MRIKFYALKLCLIMIVVFFIQIFVKGFTEIFILDSAKMEEFWRFISSVFLHGSLIHLIYNLFALALFGLILESLIGSKRFFGVFFITGILANFISVNFYSTSLGASGAIFGVIGALIVVRPMLIVWAFGLPMPIFVAGILWGFGDLAGAYGFLIGQPIDNTGNIAHLSGMIFGLLFGVFFKGRRKANKKRRDRLLINERKVRRWEDRYIRQ